MYKTHQGRTTFGSCDVEKVHAVVARSKFPSQNVQSTSVSDRFWKLTCRKSARGCGAKHIWKSKCTKHTMPAPLFKKEYQNHCRKGTSNIRPPFPLSKCMFYLLILMFYAFVHYTTSNGKRRGEYRHVSNQFLKLRRA